MQSLESTVSCVINFKAGLWGEGPRQRHDLRKSWLAQRVEAPKYGGFRYLELLRL